VTLSLKIVDVQYTDFLRRRESWNDALQGSVDNNVFMTWEWLSTWWRHFGNGRQFLLSALVDGEKIVAAAPLMSTDYRLFGVELRKIAFIGSPASDYSCFLLSDSKPEHVQMLVEHAGQYVRNWSIFELTDVPDDSLSAGILRSFSVAFDQFECRDVDRCPYISLSHYLTAESFRETLSENFRENLSRNERKLRSDFDVELEIVGGDEVRDRMETFMKLNQMRLASREQVGIFGDTKVRNFHLDIATSFAEKGWLLLSFVMLNGQPAAAQYNFKYGNKLYFYQSGFNPRFSKYGLGSLLHMWLIDRCLSEGMSEYDFLRGDEGYKRRWTRSSRVNLRFTAAQKRMIPILLKRTRLAGKLESVAELWRES
jgi:CelD/BcsL family acetyltransferase involved in cellulose biosynthesis